MAYTKWFDNVWSTPTVDRDGRVMWLVYCGRCSWALTARTEEQVEWAAADHTRCRPPHGSYASYNRGCHCSECSAGNTAYTQQLTAKYRLADGGTFVHGTARAYKQGRCRCDPCRLAGAAAQAGYRAKAKRLAVGKHPS